MKTNAEGISLIKHYEGCRLEAYKALPTEKYYTIGYGHYGADVKSGMVITRAQAEAYLLNDLKKFETYVDKTELDLNENQFSALVSFTYNCGPGNLKKLVTGRTLPEIADAMLVYNKAGGKELSGLTKRRKAERELFLKECEEDGDSMVTIGSARIDENGKATGGKAGDQKQKSTPDYSGEVSLQKFYVAKKGWYVLRPKDPKIASKIAAAMQVACLNVNIGYNQSAGYEIIKQTVNTMKPCNCDCSSLVRACVIDASGKDPGDFTTANEADKLEATGLFEKRQVYKKGFQLYTGDVLVTKTKGHTAVVTNSDKIRAGFNVTADSCHATVVTAVPSYETPAVTLKYTMQGKEVKWLQNALNSIGYDLKVDGVFGKKTLEAVKDFQKKNGLEADGIVGKKTKTALKTALI